MKQRSWFFGNDAAALRRGEEGDAGGVDEGPQLRRRIRPDHAAAGDDERLLRALQQLDGGGDAGGVALGAALGVGLGRQRDLLLVHLGGDDVGGEVEVDRPLRALHRAAVEHAKLLADAARDGGLDGQLARRGHHRDLVHLLEAAHAALVEGRRAADGDDRAGVGEGVHHAGHGVGGRRAGGRQADAGSLHEPRVGVGRHGRRLLVADVDHADAQLLRRLRDGRDRAADDVEDGVHAEAVEGAGGDVGPGDFGHGCAPFQGGPLISVFSWGRPPAPLRRALRARTLSLISPKGGEV